VTIAHSAPPVLRIDVDDAGVQEFAAVPTLRFSLRIETTACEEIRSLVLDTQIRVAAPRRPYDDAAKERLAGLFGEPHQWGRTLRSLLWTHTTLLVAPFTGSTQVDMPVGCTYDFDAGIVAYFRALDDGDIPLEFLFSGTIFYAGEGGFLQTARISWATEAEFHLPVRVWQQLIDHYYPDSAWLRLRRETAERLSAYRTRRTLASFDDAVNMLLGLEGGSWTR
jgi:hypothetical protein